MKSTDGTIYLDYQSTTPSDDRVISAMEPYFAEIFGNPHSSDHAMGWKAAEAIERSKTSVAKMLGAYSDEIIFTSGATEANNLALLGLFLGTNASNRKKILTSAIEHKSVLMPLQMLKNKFGITIETIPVANSGVIDLNILETKISEEVLLASVMLVNNEIGSIQPIKEISDLCQRHGVIFHCDATQAPGVIDMSELAILVDLLSISGHKMYGPKGIGALLARRNIHHNIEPIIHGGNQQGHLRSGTLPTALCVGMGVASDIAIDSLNDLSNDVQLKMRSLRDHFVFALNKLEWEIHINGPPLNQRHPGNANILFKGFSADEIISFLQPQLAVSTGSACSSGIPEISHVLHAIGLSSNDARASIRFSLGRTTTEDEVNEAVRLIDTALSQLRTASAAKN